MASTIAIGPVFANASKSSVGGMIHQGVKHTRTLVGANTNVGILLLLAPLAKAASLGHSGGMRAALGRVLAELTVEDARLAYGAIVKAAPQGLDEVERGDVRLTAIDFTLREGMALAKDRDTLASEYVTDFAVVFELGYPGLKDCLKQGRRLSDSVVQVYLEILARVPDTDIRRKTDRETAERISCEAGKVLRQGGMFTQAGRLAISGFDALVRDGERRLNPGTTADLMAASLFVLLVGNHGPDGIPELLACW
jgi:triphosphoribosyl-dephospho-CoA synthase